VTFTSQVAHDLSGVPLGVRLHPTQLYEAAVVLLAIPLLLWLRKTKTFQGEVFLAYMMYYAIARFFLEFVRDDPRGRYVYNLFSTSQFISVLILVFGLCLLFLLRTRPQLARAPFRTIRRIQPTAAGQQKTA
jgi:phosphatidylglycerol:prolipoprotein diacylglycerol transferase